MNVALILNVASLVAGLLSAVFWIISAVVKAPPEPGLEGKPDGSYWKGTVVNGGDLIGTMRAQAKWNSRAAFAAAATVLLQISAGVIVANSVN